ncbi:hypothetical protein VTO42DRAFT_7226 [Malbranchea cinnamomea]
MFPPDASPLARAQQDGGTGTTSMVTTVRAVTGGLAILALVVCSTRLYMRHFVMHSFGVDDCLVILALILVLGFAALSIALTFYGIGSHQNTVSSEQLATMQYMVYISLCIYLFVASAVKISLTVFIMRVFPTEKIQRIGYGIITFLILFAISGELPLILQCKPVRAAYDKTLEHFECFSADILFDIQMYQGVLMFVIDLVIIVLPMPTIWRLQMPLARRISIIGLFGLGLVACAACLARLPNLVYQKDVADFTFAGATPLIWMNVEFCLALITGSLPTLRRLLRFIPGLNSTQKYYNSRSQGQELGIMHNNSSSHGTRKRSVKLESLHSGLGGNESQERIVGDRRSAGQSYSGTSSEGKI